MQPVRAFLAVCIILLAVLAATGNAEEASSDPSHDGLQKVDSDKVALLYLRPGATLAPYDRVAILDCVVAFKKDWERGHSSGINRVSHSDMEKIKASLAAEFRKIFTDELQNKGGYTVTEKAGEDVLVLRPAIIDLDVTAPDTNTAGRTRSFNTSAGAMTLFLEVFDGSTGAILARAVDRQAARDTGFVTYSNAITNRQEADRLLRKWATMIREALDQARSH